MDITWTMTTGSGSWNPALWLLAFAAALIVSLFIRSRGRKDYKIDSDQDMPFISGNDEPENGGGHIPASNMYWGFLESMQTYYKRIVPLHTGAVTDYLAWLAGVMALTLVIGLMA